MSIESITATLNRLTKVDGVATAMVIDRDGLLIAEGSGRVTDSSENLASLLARAIHTFERSSHQAPGEIEQLIVERQGDEKLILFVTAAYILAVVTAGQANLGLVRMEMRETIDQLAPHLGTS